MSNAVNRWNQIIKSQLTKYMGVLFSLGVLAKLLALLKESYLANELGVGPSLDIYYIVILIPVFVANLFGSPIAQTIIPHIDRSDGKEASKYLASVLWFLLLVLTFVYPLVMGVQYFYLHQANFSTNLSLIILVPVVCAVVYFQVVNSFLVAVAEAYNKFFYSHFHSIWLSVLVLIALYIESGTLSLLVAFVLSYICFFLMLVFALRKDIVGILKNRPKLRIPRRVKSDYLSILIAGALGGSAFFVDQLMAADYDTGGISSLQYAFRITAVFTGLAAMSIGNVLLPQFSFLSTEKGTYTSLKLLRRSMIFILLGGGVLSAFLFVVAPFFVDLFYRHGQFSAEDGELVSTVLGVYVWYIPFYVLYYVLVRFYSSTDNNKLLIYLSGLSLILNVLFNILFIKSLGLSGLALSTVISSLIVVSLGYFLISNKINR